MTPERIEEISKRRNIDVFPKLYLFDTQIRVIHPFAVDRTEVSLPPGPRRRLGAAVARPAPQRLDHGEVVGHSTDEVPVRALYQEWKRLMSV